MDNPDARRSLAALVIASLALVCALAGNAGVAEAAGAITKKTVRAIATSTVRTLAPGLSVSNADTASHATSASTADTAGDAAKLGGLGSSSYQRSLDAGCAGAGQAIGAVSAAGASTCRSFLRGADSIPGGDLEGTYGSPTIAQGAVGANDVNFGVCSVSTNDATDDPTFVFKCTGSPQTLVSGTRPSPGVYCLDFSSPSFISILSGSVTIDASASGFPAAYVKFGAQSGCPASTDVTVTTWLLKSTTAGSNVTGTATNEIWHGIFY